MPGPDPQTIIGFWRDAGPDRWFAKDEDFDRAIAQRFAETHHAAARGELADWANTAEGTLALILLLDQFPRNLFRGSGHAFATDPLARAIAHAGIERGHDQAVSPDLRVFFYLPFEHSEALEDQDLCLGLCRTLDAESGSEWAKWAELHCDIIVRFGRFPHRNAALGRATTAEELAFLDAGGFSG